MIFYPCRVLVLTEATTKRRLDSLGQKGSLHAKKTVKTGDHENEFEIAYSLSEVYRFKKFTRPYFRLNLQEKGLESKLLPLILLFKPRDNVPGVPN